MPSCVHRWRCDRIIWWYRASRVTKCSGSVCMHAFALKSREYSKLIVTSFSISHHMIIPQERVHNITSSPPPTNFRPPQIMSPTDFKTPLIMTPLATTHYTCTHTCKIYIQSVGVHKHARTVHTVHAYYSHHVHCMCVYTHDC